MNRIYLVLSIDQLKSANHGRYYLSYLQIRCATRNQCGGFYGSKLAEVLNVKPRAAKIHLQKLLSLGFIIDQGNDHYRCVSQKKIADSIGCGMKFTISDERLMSFSWKNIASFRAMIHELELERYKRYQKHLGVGYMKVDEQGVREKICNPERLAWDKLMSLECAADLTGLSESTIKKYRKRQDLSKYEWKLVFTNLSKGKPGDRGREFSTYEHKGYHFVLGNKLVFSPISKRVSNISLKRA